MKRVMSLFLAAVLLLPLAGCAQRDQPSPRNPVTVTIWHTYVEDMRNAFDTMVTDFNSTVGAENGITVKVTSITDAKIVNEQLTAAANKDPGAPDPPDMAVVYPTVAVTLAERGAIVDLEAYFSQAELGSFVPQFVEEGRLGGDHLYLIPVAKSAEVLYVNRTLFDRFSGETGVGLDQLATFEGIAEAAVAYYQWTDAQTPAVADDGKMFFYPEGLFNQAMIGFQQLGGDIVRDQQLYLSDPIFQRIWDSYYVPAVKGGTAVYDGWSNYLAATGDVVCAAATSAGAAFYPAHITYPDNTKEDVIFDVLPYPVFRGGEKVVFQRGGGFCVTRSTPTKEYAACLFLKWLTEAERNLAFCANIGYTPVRRESFDRIMSGDFPEIENPMVEKTLLTVAAMQKDYRFYFPPVFDGFDHLQTLYADRLRQEVQSSRDDYLRLAATQERTAAYEAVSRGVREGFVMRLNP